MGYSIRKNWISSFVLIKKKPVILLPFVIIAFFECLALELIYFSSRKPISVFANPIIRKFFGEGFIHYPNNLLLLPKLFYYAQVAVYIFLAILLTAISINIFKNIRMGLPLKANALIKNALKRYLSFVIFGIIIIFFMILMKRADVFIFTKFIRFASKYMPQAANKLYFIGLSFFLFLSNVILLVFSVLTVPLIVIQKKSLFKALIRSIYLGFRNFFSIFGLIFLPFLVYLPLMLLKSGAPQLINKTFPEINLYITAAGIVIALFIDCFIVICASQFLLDKESLKK